MKLKGILVSFGVLCLVLISLSSVFAMPIPDYYYKYDFFPLHLETAYDIYDTGGEILFYITSQMGEVSKEPSKNWTFKFSPGTYPIKELVAYQYANETQIKIPLEKKDEYYSFESTNRPSILFLFGSLKKNSVDLDVTKIPMLIYPTKSDAKVIIHQKNENLEYDFKTHGGYYTYNFNQQTDFIKNIINTKPATIDNQNKILSVINLNQPIWSSKDILTVQGYNQTLQDFVNSFTGGEYLYSDKDWDEYKRTKANKKIAEITSWIIAGLVLIGLIYLMIRKIKKKR